MLLTGVDEVGVGPLAGPLVAVAITVEVPDEFDARRPERWWPIPGVADSKKVPEKKRPDLFDRINEFVFGFNGAIGVYQADALLINQVGHWEAYRRAMRRAVLQATKEAGLDSDLVVVDGRQPVSDLHGQRQLVVPKADQKFFVVAAASNIAKLLRDEEMIALGKRYPQYGFEAHKGYGTPTHIEAMRRHGLTPQHREKASRTALSSSR